MLVLSVGPTMNAQKERHPGSFHVADWISQQAVNIRAVFTLKINFFSLTNLKFGHQRIVLMGQWLELQFTADETGGINLARMVIVARDHHRALPRAMTLTQNDGFVG